MGKPNRIKEWREAKKLTLEELSERSGISVSYLSRMESGARNVSLKNLAKLSKALLVPESKLVPQGPSTVRLVGYVGAGAHYYPFEETDFGYVDAPEGANANTVAAEIRGTSLGVVFDGWLVFYDKVTDLPTTHMVGRLCVVGLRDGTVMVKQLYRGGSDTTWHLISNSDPPIMDAEVAWVAHVKQMSPR